MKNTSLSSVIGTFKSLFWKQSKIGSSFIALLPSMENRVSYAINTNEELVVDVSLVLSVTELQEWYYRKEKTIYSEKTMSHCQEVYPKMFLYCWT